MSSTDVKHSIAGFYYQVLLACKELVCLLNAHSSDDSYVAVELGADVRIQDGGDTFMEAKFYNVTHMTRHHPAVTHSIYNFFTRFQELKGIYKFKPNVPPSPDDRNFFENWPKAAPIPADYIKYIKECFVYESLSKKEIHDGQNYAAFKKEYKKSRPNTGKPHYKSGLIKHLEKVGENSKYRDYMLDELHVSDELLAEYVPLLEFDFPSVNQSKYISVEDLKESIAQELYAFDQRLKEEDQEKLRLLIMERFLDSTVAGTLRVVRVAECKEMVENCQSYELAWIDKPESKRSIREIEMELRDYEKLLRKMGGEYENKVDDIMSLVLNMKSQLVSQMHEHGTNRILGRYVLAESDYPLETLNLFKAISELMVKTDRVTEPIRLFGHQGINNLSIGEQDVFSVRTVPAASSVSKDSEMLLNRFIEHTRITHEMKDADGNETVILEAACKICELDKSTIDDTVIDIYKTSKNKEYQSLYKAFDYRCTHCLRLDYEGNCPFLERLRGGDLVEAVDASAGDQ